MSERQAPEVLYIFVLVVVAISVVGFLTGTASRGEQFRRPRTSVPQASPATEVPLARSYRQLREQPRGAGSGWGESLRFSCR